MLKTSWIEDEHHREDEDLIRVGRVDGGMEDVVDERARIEDQPGVH